MGKNTYYDLDCLPSRIIREEMEEFLRSRVCEVSISTIYEEYRYYKRICFFLQKRAKGAISFRDKQEETWLRQFKGWMLEEKIPLTFERHRSYRRAEIVQSHIVSYLKRILEFTEKVADKRAEQEKDIWELEKLDIPIKTNA